MSISEFEPGQWNAAKVNLDQHRVLVLTQTCDLANQKVDDVVVASVFDAQQLVDRRILKAADIRGSIRANRVWGLYFLPAQAELGLGDMIVDLRRLHTVRLDLLRALCRAGQRLARVQTPYREHLAKHFADTFSRIGLPQPYETM
ncbi:MAG: hypothetical protein SH850_05580 [Planctomycetaceae bacterium]|nr:hypothetical protein [Planctomycetaceae bacterium]